MTRTIRRTSDRGAVLVLAAFIMVALLTIAALVVDLGQGRLSNRESQTASDLAALSAGYFLAGKGQTDAAGNAIGNAQLACEAAIDSIQSNVEGFQPKLDLAARKAACKFLPADTSSGCASASAPDPIERGPYTLTIGYPSTKADISDSRLGGDGSGVRDGDDPCDRMRITLRKVDSTRFGGVVGVDSMTTEASAVVEGDVNDKENVAPAFLILERTRCGALSNSVNGAGNRGIIVEWNHDTSTPQPGVMHVDSNATHSDCKGTENANGYAIWGSKLSDGTPSITAQSAPAVGTIAAQDGIIQSTATNNFGAGKFPGGLSIEPTSVTRVYGRGAVDLKYNTASVPNTAAITDLHSKAYGEVSSSLTPAGYTVVDCSGLPTNVGGDPLLVFVDCDSFGSESATPAMLLGASTVVFKDSVSLGNGKQLYLNGAAKVVVRGQLAVPQGEFRAPFVADLFVGGGIKVDGNGRISLNAPNDTPDGVDDCDGRKSSPTWTNTTRAAIFGGNPALDIAGIGALCQTTVYLAGPKASSNSVYAIQTDSLSATTSATPCSETSCPKTVSNTASGARFHVNGTLTWVAPNQYPNTKVPKTEPQRLEDLAYWTETSDSSHVLGVLLATGVFFGPNANYEVRSPATGSPRDAQFIARRLSMNQGTLTMRPSTANSVQISIAGEYGLIR